MGSVLAESASSTFPRSHSSSDLPKHHSNGFKSAQSARDSDELPRSASYTLLPVIESSAYKLDDGGNADDIAKYLRDTRATSEAGTAGKLGSKLGETREQALKLQKASRRKSTVSGWMSKVRGDYERKEASSEKAPTHRPPQPQPIPIRASAVRSKISQPLVSLDDDSSSRSPSRSPSPSKKLNLDLMDHSPDNYSTPASSVSSASPKLSFASLSMRSGNATPKFRSESPGKGFMKRGTQLLKKSKGIQTGFFEDSSIRSANTSNVSLGGISALNINGPPTPACSRPGSRGLKEKKGASTNQSHKKDELWAAFSSLDSDYQKFQAKTSALKTNVVRSTLLPFLRNHQSTANLEPEHLERRVNILGKWWRGLLDMLDMQNGMAGIDRPVILEAITGIMVRAEWRLSPSAFAPLAERPSVVNTPRTGSTGSFSSMDTFLADSVHHNVRALFVRNLNSQMSTIVEKMSLRHAPASLVTFCGKATAYAFFFCPGVADALARVWKTPLDTIKRVADEFGLPRRFGAPVDGDDIVTAFPPNLQSLGWTSAKALLGQLRKPANLPVEVAKISWQGTWASRWCGRDSDLFYVFCRHYHILMEEFLPPDTPLIEKARAPAFVLVHSQIVSIIDGTLHRNAPASDHGPGPIDVLAGADASVAALPLSPSSNIARLMCENRLIMLVRDILSEQPPPGLDDAQRTFASAFALSLRAAAKKTSLYDHHACSVLCDLLEEALPIYTRYAASTAASLHFAGIDWPFWRAACERMLDSAHTMTEVRVLALLYTTWPLLVASPARKAALCLDWLLSPPVFARFFTHWCPLVRAYYMRLLCWRICRPADPSLLDTRILHAAAARLAAVWTAYHHRHTAALSLNSTPPSTTPCHPAPGRRLLIVRNDAPAPAAGLFLSFDGILGGGAGARHAALLTPPASPPKDAAAVTKRRWSVMGRMNPFAGDAAAAGVKGKLEAARLDTAERCRREVAVPGLMAGSGSAATSAASAETETETPPQRPPHRALSFKFSLEWHPAPLLGAHSEGRQLAAPRLPGAAEGVVRGRVRGEAGDDGGDDVGDDGDDGWGKYAGRALVEWALVGREFENFVARRVAEGVPGVGDVEVPALGVEGLKRAG